MAKKATRYIVDEVQLKWIEREAKRRSCSMSQVVRDLVVAEIERRKANK